MQTNPNPSYTVPVRPEVGQIFEMSWGYDQTNVNYFQVTRLSKAGVFVREIGCEHVPGTAGFMSEKVRPCKGKFLARSQWTGQDNPELFRKFHATREGFGISFGRHYYASSVSENSSTYHSWYA